MTKKGPKSATKEDVDKWIFDNGYFDKYEVVHYEPGSQFKITFIDKDRSVEFKRRFSDFKTDLKSNPLKIFNPSKEEKKEIVKKSFEQKYGEGITSPFCLKEVREKASKTIEEKYGVDNVFKSDNIKDKIKKTNVEKYGVENVLMKQDVKKKALENAWTPDVKEKRERTFNERYGGTNSFNSDQIIQKIERSNIQKYGKSYALNDKILEKRKRTMLERYGTEFPGSSSSIREKIKDTCEKRYGGPSPSSDPSIVKKSFETKIKKGSLQLYEGRTLKDWAEEKKISHSYFQQLVAQNGFHFAKTFEKEQTNIEKVVNDILIEIGVSFRTEEYFGKYRADFFLQDHNLIIECDGLYYHSEFKLKDKHYHKNKKKFYKENGFDSLFFRSNEILTKKEIVKSVILNKIRKNNKKVFARKCDVAEVVPSYGNKFFNENHLMGRGAGKIYGLLFEGDLVAAIQIKSIGGEETYEISRFCTKNGVSVVGGFSRLINTFIKDVSPKKIITFVDLRYGSGDYMKQWGWNRVSSNISFKWTDGKRSINWRRFRKKEGYEAGLAKIWDCGQAKWELDL